jgi:hypothetical protein
MEHLKNFLTGVAILGGTAALLGVVSLILAAPYGWLFLLVLLLIYVCHGLGSAIREGIRDDY